MALHPEAKAVIEATAAQGGLIPEGVSAAEMRAAFAASWRMPENPVPVGRVYERTIPGPAADLRVRVYEPRGDGPFPAVVWFHGGGWVIGSLAENEQTCRTLCAEAEAVVVSVEYRLAPEDPFPAAAEDAHAALTWVTEHGAEVGVDTTRIAVAGESAGANLAAVACLMVRDRGGRLPLVQVLACPVIAPPGDRPSYVDYGVGHFLTRANMDFFFAQYARDAADLNNPYLDPLAATDLTGLPAALVMTAEYDPLRDEGEEFAHRLMDAGVPTELVRYHGQVHGFFALLVDRLSIAEIAHQRAIDTLRKAFTRGLTPYSSTERKS
ncbi:alpha/beta hydrolase [Actinokineospora sp. NBRC 105648]|uniref:alpha/beta hydrolase n=1 Tax=Actinokineospora sp. NBRC 105648 TaxID=3032206 RepID=UPI0024A1DD4C|nr:alpha/beta hydrolase [Actinokineospora sp. NBRC 105648]GLZ41359.1 putative lipase/esterase LipN [Actinokineospora sp. NBRC 105648]